MKMYDRLLEANLEKLDQFFSGQWLTLKSYLVNLVSVAEICNDQ